VPSCDSDSRFPFLVSEKAKENLKRTTDDVTPLKSHPSHSLPSIEAVFLLSSDVDLFMSGPERV